MRFTFLHNVEKVIKSFVSHKNIKQKDQLDKTSKTDKINQKSKIDQKDQKCKLEQFLITFQSFKPK